MGNLPFTATDDQVSQLFGQHGTVHSVALINDRETGNVLSGGLVVVRQDLGTVFMVLGVGATHLLNRFGHRAVEMDLACRGERIEQCLPGHIHRFFAVAQAAGQALKIATIDQDATIIESHKAAAYCHYAEGRGYQPMVAVWAEADLVLADEFRDGNVPAQQEPLTCAKLAFAALPELRG